MINYRAVGYAAIDTLPDEILLEIFDFSVWISGDWETLIKVCRRWRSIVLSAPCRLDLQLLCTRRTLVRERLCIWPKFPIVLRVLDGDFDETNDNIIAALEHHDRIYEINFDCISTDNWESLIESMEVSFPALTILYLDSISYVGPLFRKSFLGGSAPNLQSICLNNIEFPTLPDVLLSTKYLVNLSLSGITRSTYEAMVDCLFSLPWLEALLVEIQSCHDHPHRASRHPARAVLSKLTSLTFHGVMEYLDHLSTHIDAPSLEILDILFFNPVDFDYLRRFPFTDRTKTFEGFNQAHMNFDDDWLEVILSGPTCGTSLTLSTTWFTSGWDFLALTQDCRPFSPPLPDLFDYRYSPHWAEDMGTTPWLEFLRIFSTVESLYLPEGLALCIALALRELAGQGVTEVLPALQSILIIGPPTSAAGIIQEMETFVAARELSGHHVAVNIGQSNSGSKSVGRSTDDA